MRSIAEIAFRLRQESANLFLLVAKPAFSGNAGKLQLPDPGKVAQALKGSTYAGQLEQIAEQILAHQFPLLGITVDTGVEIRWQRDYVHGVESGVVYFRRIPYLNFAAVGDHKFIWELNRHQHLVALAQAFLLTGRREFLAEIFAQLESWFDQNPFQRGINWASALEVAFRALSWIWIFHLVGSEMTDAFRKRFLTGLYRHGLHLAENLSVYFSPNTHLLGEAVALHALGVLFPQFPGAKDWQRRGAETVKAQLTFQIWPDGAHFEQSSYYHVYALDMFLFHYLLAGRPAEFEPALKRMGNYLWWLMGPSRRIHFVGDDDGGRFFHPFGDRSEFGRTTLANCGLLLNRSEWIGTALEHAQQAAWWLGPEVLKRAQSDPILPEGARIFKNSGTAFLQSGQLFLQMDCGPFGWGGAGHSHSDSLSIVLQLAGERIFVDPGTYTYLGDPQERAWFRGSSAHNTVRINGLDQADPPGPFRWSDKPEVALETWAPDADGGFIHAVCRYKGFTHRRRVLLNCGRLLVLDEIEGPDGEHTCEQIWQLGPAAAKVNIAVSAPTTRCSSKFSPAYGARQPGSAIVAKQTGPLPMAFAMLLHTTGEYKVTVEDARRMMEEHRAQADSPHKESTYLAR